MPSRMISKKPDDDIWDVVLVGTWVPSVPGTLRYFYKILSTLIQNSDEAVCYLQGTHGQARFMLLFPELLKLKGEACL